MTTILLAAGLSERMGENKLLLPYKGRTIIESTLNAIQHICDRIIVVVGNDKERVMDVLSSYNVEFLYNPEYKTGQRSSTIAGIESVDDDFAVLPGDLPLLEEKDVEGIFSLLSNYSISRAFYNDIPGHPVAYRKENRERLLSFPGSMKEYLATTTIGIYNASIGTVFDIDTPEKYEDLLRNIDPSILN